MSKRLDGYTCPDSTAWYPPYGIAWFTEASVWLGLILRVGLGSASRSGNDVDLYIGRKYVGVLVRCFCRSEIIGHGNYRTARYCDGNLWGLMIYQSVNSASPGLFPSCLGVHILLEWRSIWLHLFGTQELLVLACSTMSTECVYPCCCKSPRNNWLRNWHYQLQPQMDPIQLSVRESVRTSLVVPGCQHTHCF